METIALNNLTFTTLTDEILAGEVRFHPEAIAELYRRHFQTVYRYQLGRTGNAFEAEDLTTVTFVAALEGIQKFRGSGTFLSCFSG